MFDVEIKSFPSLHLAAMAHKGSYMNIGQAFEKLMVRAGPQGWLANGVRMIGIFYDDPAEVNEAELRAKACIILPDDLKIEDDGMVQPLDLPAGRTVCLRFKGPYAEMEGAYRWLFGTWLPQSGEEAADRPCIEEYLNNPRDVAPPDLLTDIHLPLK